MKELPNFAQSFITNLPTHAQLCACANAVSIARQLAPESEAKLHALEMALWAAAGAKEDARERKAKK